MNSSRRRPDWNALGLAGKYIKALKRAKYNYPTPIQTRALPHCMKIRNVSAVAPAGTGKTLCYILAVWHYISASPRQVLVLVPTRELAFQCSKMFQALGFLRPGELCVVVGGRNIKTQTQQMSGHWKILVATPGRILDFLETNQSLLRNIGIQVTDEFDKMLKLGFLEQVERIMKAVPPMAVRMWFSATPPETSRDIIRPGTISIDLTQKQKPRLSREVFYFLKSSKSKTHLCLEALSETDRQTIIFAGNREKADHLNGFFHQKGISCRTLHGRLPQQERTEVYQNFMEGKFPVLIATDIAARGLDTLNVDLVINFDLPRNAAEYLHRKGRAGRQGRPGLCLSLAGPDEYIPMRNIRDGLPYPVACHPEYADMDGWFKAARMRHRKKTGREERIDKIKRAQGLK